MREAVAHIKPQQIFRTRAAAGVGSARGAGAKPTNTRIHFAAFPSASVQAGTARTPLHQQPTSLPLCAVALKSANPVRQRLERGGVAVAPAVGGALRLDPVVRGRRATSSVLQG
jgi:hypothetical protein